MAFTVDEICSFCDKPYRHNMYKNEIICHSCAEARSLAKMNEALKELQKLSIEERILLLERYVYTQQNT